MTQNLPERLMVRAGTYYCRIWVPKDICYGSRWSSTPPSPLSAPVWAKSSRLVTGPAGVNSLLALASAMFTAIFKVLPDVPVAWHDAWVGGLLTGLMFTIGKFLIGFYIGSSGIASTYGAAASIVTILVWIYYSSQIVLFGTEVTKAYAEDRVASNPATTSTLG